ncbi:MAG: VCBS repeat-containing protein [Myxococcales bacterium]|nr:VCBS repeat-containing protein [Myxococcales bacterium]
MAARNGLCAGILLVGVGCEPPPCARGAACLAVAEARQTRWGFAPESLLWVDVDGDGQQDLVAASHARGTVSVVWGAERTLGGTATTWSVASTVAGVAVADADGDGFVDLITAAPDDDAVAVLRGRGGRGFVEVARSTKVGDGPRGVIAADLDGAGAAELVSVDADGFVSVVRGGEVTRVAVGPGPRGLAAGDVDGDGALDVVVALADRGALQVLLGDGRGGLAPGALHAVGAAPHAVVVEDLDDDGAVDLASADALMGTVSVLFGDGAGGVREQARWPAGPVPRALASLRWGGARALAVLSPETGGVRVVDPRRGMVAEGTLMLGGSALATGDLDGDGREEPIVSGADGIGGLVPGVGVQLDPLWRVNPPAAAGDTSDYFDFGHAVDVDGDGVDEILRPLIVVAGSEATPGSWGLWRGGELVAELVMAPGMELVQWGFARDIDGDAARDVVLVGASGAQVFLNRPSGFEAASWALPSLSFTTMIVEDVGMDGVAQAVGVRPSGDGSVLEVHSFVPGGSVGVATVPLAGRVGFLQGVEVAGRRALLASVDERLTIIDDVLGEAEVRGLVRLQGLAAVAMADLDGDERLDGALCSGSELVVVMDLLGEATARERLGEHGCEAVTTADLDGDGALDLLARRGWVGEGAGVLTPWLRKDERWSAWGSVRLPKAAQVEFARLDGDAVPDVWSGGGDQVTAGYKVGLGPGLIELPVRRFGGAGPQFADLDGDGARDMFAYSFGVTLAYGDGDGGFGVQRQFSREEALAGGSVNSAALADFDGDGEEDVLVAVRPVARWRTELRRLRFDDGDEVASETLTHWPQTDVRLAVGEVDGDGVRDLVAFAPELGLVLLRGRGDGTFADGERVADAPERLYAGRVVDMDGDGAQDLLWWTAEGLMLGRGLGGGALAPAASWWRTDVSPSTYALGDVDHDGRQDVAAVRSSTAMFAFGGGTKVAGVPGRLGANVEGVALADLEGDGTVELLMVGQGAHQRDGEVTLAVGRGSGSGAFSFTEEVLPARARAVRAMDMDGDGVREVVLTGPGEVTVVRQGP